MLKAKIVVLEDGATTTTEVEAVSPQMMMARVEMFIKDLPQGSTVTVEFQGKVVLCKAK